MFVYFVLPIALNSCFFLTFFFLFSTPELNGSGNIFPVFFWELGDFSLFYVFGLITAIAMLMSQFCVTNNTVCCLNRFRSILSWTVTVCADRYCNG